MTSFYLKILFVYYCYSFFCDGVSLDMKKLNYFSTKTAYRFSNLKHFAADNQNLDLNSNILGYDPLEFEPKRIWAIIRHGTRYPGKKVIAKYENLTQIRDDFLKHRDKVQLTDDQIENFVKWKPFPIDPKREKFLAYEGGLEMVQLGNNMKTRFPTLFNEESSFAIFHTPTERTENSALKFIEGLSFNFDKDLVKRVARDDPVLRPYKQCKKWRYEIKKNKDAVKEMYKFKEHPVIDNLVNEFREKLNLYYITINDIQVMYTMCGYENAWNIYPGDVSPWCHLFDEASLKIMEYLEDLEYYWVDGFGHELTTKVACKTAQNLFSCLSPNSKEPQINLLFTHSGTLLKFYAFMGIFKDDFPLLSSNFGQERLWKTSKIDPFGANIFFVLLKSKQHDENFVLTLHNENVIRLPNCDYSKFNLCRFEDFKAAYLDKFYNCKLENLCTIKEEL